MSEAFMEIDIIPSIPSIIHDFHQLANDLDIRSMREPLKRSISQVIAPAFRENFNSGGRPGWQPLSEATTKQKVRRGQSSEPLVATGKLRKVAGQQNIWTIDGMSGEAYISNLQGADYGAIHQTGGDGPGQWSMPARPWATITDQETDEIAEVFGRWIDERVAHRLNVLMR